MFGKIEKASARFKRLKSVILRGLILEKMRILENYKIKSDLKEE